ncbi:aldo/keto reductase [Actinomadura barringtoniae]|uniref:Aldo/keto reductase n=1 Tax=Actinomadura barringtoniae TaxID=1427535 RepID=A0A939T5I6_9ACTN|nr:aldo/keto reductase [Actinomadura barringtoniae]MBO2453801.1 aldo/keto reductase [Actinomadura barringtoniae]
MTNETNSSDWTLGGDLPIKRLGFGAMRLPASRRGGPPNDRDISLEVLRRAAGLGVNHIDTAAFYFHGDLHANDLIREGLKPYADDLVIATKVGPKRRPEDPMPIGEMEPGELRAEVERNLTELGLDRLDLVYLRVGGMEPAQEPIGDRFAVLARLRDEGLIRHLGVSNIKVEHLKEAMDIAPVAAVQNWFDITKPQDAEMLEICEREGIGYAPYFPLGGFGLPDDERVNAIAERHGATVAQVLLAGLLELSPVMLAIPGTGSPAHLEENMGAAGLRLTERDLAELRQR